MSNRIFTRADGSHALYTSQDLWGYEPGEGTITAEEAMRRTGMADMELIEGTSYTRITESGRTVDYEMPKSKGILLHDNKFNTTTPVGNVGIKRVTTQFDELVYPMDELVQVTGGTIAVFGLLNPGSRWFVIVQLPEGVEVGGDQYNRYVWGVDGLYSNYIVQPRIERIACTNQLPRLMSNMRSHADEYTYVMRHTSRAKVDVVAMRRAVNATTLVAEELDEFSKIMLSSGFTSQEFEAYTDELFGVPEPDQNGRISAAARTQHRKRQQKLLGLFEGTDESGGRTTESTWRNGHQTKWTAFQAVTEYIDWKQPVHGKGVRERGVRRLERTMDNSIARLKNHAAQLLVP